MEQQRLVIALPDSGGLVAFSAAAAAPAAELAPAAAAPAAGARRRGGSVCSGSVRLRRRGGVW